MSEASSELQGHKPEPSWTKALRIAKQYYPGIEEFLLKQGKSRIEDGKLIVEFSRKATREVMEPYLETLSNHVGFQIVGEYEHESTAPGEEADADSRTVAEVTAESGMVTDFASNIALVNSDRSVAVIALPLGAGKPHIREKSSWKATTRRRKSACKKGVPESIRASSSFLNLSRNAQGILRLMYRFSKFDRAKSRRVAEVSRRGLADLQYVEPRTISNVWAVLEAKFLVRRLRRGYLSTGCSTFELPVNMKHVRRWRMEAGGKGRY
jgi:hypothetical protein